MAIFERGIFFTAYSNIFVLYYEFGAFRPVFKLSSDPYLSGIVQFYVLRIFKYISCLFFNLKNIFFVNPWPFMIDPLKHRVYLKKLCLFDPAVSTEIGYKHTNAHTENSYKNLKKIKFTDNNDIFRFELKFMDRKLHDCICRVPFLFRKRRTYK